MQVAAKIILYVTSIVLAWVVNEICRKHWAFNTVKAADFQHIPNMTENEIPTTYYSKGDLKELLKDFDDRWHLYRLRDGETFDFDPSEISFPVLAHPVPEKLRQQSTLCSPPFQIQLPPQEINTSQIFKEKSWYASFAKLSREDAKMMFNKLGLNIAFETAVSDHGFISNFDEPMLTSPIHAAPTILSMAVQLIGSKSWIFTENKDYRDEEMWKAVPVSSVMRPQRAPTKNFNIWVYTSRPGDVLFFPESWGHMVYTHPGPCILMNYRKLGINSFLRQPINFITAILNVALFTKPWVTRKTNQFPALGFEWSDNIIKKIDGELCPEGKGLTPWDAYMLNFFKTKADKNFEADVARGIHPSK